MKFGVLVRINALAECEEKFRIVCEHGFNCCQLVYKPEKYLNDDAVLIKKAALKYGIEICAMFVGFRDGFTKWDIYDDYKTTGLNNKTYGAERVEYVKEASRFAFKAGIRQIIVHAGFVPNNPFSEEYAGMVDVMSQLASYCKKNDQELLFETGAESPVTLKRLIEDCKADNLFINFDTANLILYGYGNPVDAIYTFGEYIRNMHAKDGLPPVNTHCIGEMVSIGTGYVDFTRVFTELKKIGYDKYVIIENEISNSDNEKEVMNGFKYIKKIYEHVYQNNNKKQ